MPFETILALAPDYTNMAKADTGGEFEHAWEASFPQGTDALKSRDFPSPRVQLIWCQLHRGEFSRLPGVQLDDFAQRSQRKR
jgi:hypothetical protein